MPTVPQWQSNIQDQGLPSVRFTGANPEDVRDLAGGGKASEGIVDAAEGLAKMGGGIADQIAKAQAEAKQRADDLATQEAYAKTLQYKNDLVYNPDTGAIMRKGKAALGISEQYTQAFDKYSQDLEDNLANDNQRLMYRKIRLQQRSDLYGDLERHTAQEYGKFQDEVEKTGVEAIQNDAILHYTDPAKVGQSLVQLQALIMSGAARHGDDGTIAKTKLQEATSKIHRGIIDQLTSTGKDLEAKRYIEGLQAQADKGLIAPFTAEDQAYAQKAIERSSFLGESQRQTARILSETKDPLEAYNKAREIQEPKVQEEVQKMLRDRFSIDEAYRKKQDELSYEKAFKQLKERGGLEKVDPGLFASLPAESVRRLEQYDQAVKKGVLGEKSYPEYARLKKLADENPKAFLAISPVDIAANPSLTNTHKEELIKDQSRMRGADAKDAEKAKEEISGWKNRHDIVTAEMKRARILDQSGQGTIQSEAERIFGKLRATKPDAGIEEYQKIARGLIDKAILDGRVKPTPPKEPKKPKPILFDTPQNKAVIDEELGALKIKDHNADKAIRGAARDAFEVYKQAANAPMPYEELRGTVKMLGADLTLKKRSALGVDWLYPDVKKKGYQITFQDVPKSFLEVAQKDLAARRISATPAVITHWFRVYLATKGPWNGE